MSVTSLDGYSGSLIRFPSKGLRDPLRGPFQGPLLPIHLLLPAGTDRCLIRQEYQLAGLCLAIDGPLKAKIRSTSYSPDLDEPYTKVPGHGLGIMTINPTLLLSYQINSRFLLPSYIPSCIPPLLCHLTVYPPHRDHDGAAERIRAAGSTLSTLMNPGSRAIGPEPRRRRTLSDGVLRARRTAAP